MSRRKMLSWVMQYAITQIIIYHLYKCVYATNWDQIDVLKFMASHNLSFYENEGKLNKKNILAQIFHSNPMR